MHLKLRSLVLLFFSLQACAQQPATKYFNMDFAGHKFTNTSTVNFDENRLAYTLWDNMPREWYESSTTQHLIVRTAAKDTLLITVKIEFSDTQGGISSAKLQKGTFALGKNHVGQNGSTKCPIPEGKVGPYIEVRTSSVDMEKSKEYVSGSYNFHDDSGSIVIEDIQKDSNSIGIISGYFEGTVSHETTTIDTHLDEDAICKRKIINMKRYL